MPFSADLWILSSLGFFISIVINFAEFVFIQPFSTWYFGYISPPNFIIFSFGFFWLYSRQTRCRIIVIFIMIIGVILIFITKTPYFIYDHNIKAVGINNQNGFKIYSNGKIPKFISDYWAS